MPRVRLLPGQPHRFGRKMTFSETDAASISPTLGAQLLPVHAELEPILTGTRAALEGGRLVVIVGSWHTTRGAVILPFHIYLDCAGLHHLLPVHPRLGVVCFRPTDLRVLDLPLYNTTATLDVRRTERVRQASLATR